MVDDVFHACLAPTPLRLIPSILVLLRILIQFIFQIDVRVSVLGLFEDLIQGLRAIELIAVISFDRAVVIALAVGAGTLRNSSLVYYHQFLAYRRLLELQLRIIGVVTIDNVLVIVFIRLLRVSELHQVLESLTVKIVTILPRVGKLNPDVADFCYLIIIIIYIVIIIIVLRVGAPVLLFVGGARAVDQLNDL